MQRIVKVIMVIISLILIMGSILSFIFPIIKNDINDTLEIHWSNPKGIRFNDLSEGDEIHVDFRSHESEISIYLLTQDQADDLRSPAFYKEDPPDPIYTGKEGETTIIITKDGDYELLFWNTSFRKDHYIDYSIRTDTQKERTISFISGTSLLLIAIIPMIIIIIDRVRSRPG